MSWTSLHTHSHFSLLDGLSRPEQIATRCSELGYKSCAITDHGSISGAVSFSTAMKNASIKPILGCEFYFAHNIASDKHSMVSHILILAKNLKGWKDLVKLVSFSNDESNFYHKPRIDTSFMRGDFIVITGHPGSSLYDALKISDEYAQTHLDDLKFIFGSENIFIEAQLVARNILIDKIRNIARANGLKLIATGDCHYTRKADADDHRVLLASAMKTTFKEISKKKELGQPIYFSEFFDNDNFHIPTTDELLSYGNTKEEIDNTMIVTDMIDEYDITSAPKLPVFPCPNGMSNKDYLLHLCREGWKNKYKPEWNTDVYVDRIKKELSVINEANLEGYFLVVQDYVNYAKKQGWLVGPGRGSGAGCLISYLIGITSIDPIKHDLLFERFYNAGRNTKDRISLPDIDCDFPISKRGKIIEYIKQKYGKNKVSQMVTFGRMQGRGALKEVLRIHDICSYEEINNITKNIPQEQEIIDQLEETKETSIIRWTLENEPKYISDYCIMNDDGTLSGDYAQYFQQAINLEGVYRTQGKHAAGVIISSEPLDEACPMVRDKSGDEKIAGMAMGDMESMGHIKFDVLGVATLDKLMAVNNLLMKGKLYD